MPFISEQPLPEVTREPGAALRIWYLQPQLSLVGGPPWRVGETPNAEGIQLLQDVLAQEGTGGVGGSSPVLILLPEYSIRKDDIGTVRVLAAQAKPNTVIVFGVEQLTPEEALNIEAKPELWEGEGKDRFTNCAAVCVGASEQIFLQPKIVPSEFEPIRFWSGRTIRYFSGANFSFIVQVCADLLRRPAASNNAEAVSSWLLKNNRRLSCVVWIQHNDKPRSLHFVNSLRIYCELQATILAVPSRASTCRTARLDNYAVAGAVFHQSVLARYFRFLDGDFHYVEPLAGDPPISRAVLLRYDADVHRVRTVLADSLAGATSIERSTVFSDSQPFTRTVDGLVVSRDHLHIEDLLSVSVDIARTGSGPGWAEAIERFVKERLVRTVGAKELLAFLDLALLPRPAAGIVAHPSGALHPTADYLCRCWDHRTCVDFLMDPARESTRALATVLAVLGLLEWEGVVVVPVYLADFRTYFEVRLETGTRYIAVVAPFAYDGGEVENRLPPRKTLDVGYIVLGTKHRSRPLIRDVDPRRAVRQGAVNQADAGQPGIRALYQEDLEGVAEARDLGARLAQLFAS